MLGPTTYRLAWRRKMVKRYKALAVLAVLAMAALVVVPAGISTHQATVVTGHSTFYNGDEYDPCLAAIVGIMRLRVMWFNDMVLVERYNGDGAYIYLTEIAAPSPLARNLVSSGMFYDFVDPNGVEWNVQEAYWEEEVLYDVRVNGGVNPNTAPSTPPPDPSGSSVVNTTIASVGTKRYYTWIVAVGKPQRDAWKGADNHDLYNFVVLANTCKFQKATQANATVDTHVNNGPYNGHPNNAEVHDHQSYHVNLWVGSAPKILPVGLETPNWVTNQASAAANSQTQNDPPAGQQPS